MEKKIYNTKSQKVGDFIIGFVMGSITGIAVTLTTFSWLVSGFSTGAFAPFIIPATILAVILLAVIIGYLIGRKRRYMGIGFLFGAVTVIVACLLLLGSCILALKGVLG